MRFGFLLLPVLLISCTPEYETIEVSVDEPAPVSDTGVEEVLGLWCDGREGIKQSIDSIIELKRLKDGSHQIREIRGDKVHTAENNLIIFTSNVEKTGNHIMWKEGTSSYWYVIQEDGNLEMREDMKRFGVATRVESYDVPNECRK